jgi:hypothetical protein
VKIRIERSGGFTGIPLFNEMDTKELPSPLLQIAKKIIETKKTSSLPLKSHPKGSADHYTYKISIQDGTNLRVVECNQYDLKDDLKSLVKYVERNSKQKAK